MELGPPRGGRRHTRGSRCWQHLLPASVCSTHHKHGQPCPGSPGLHQAPRQTQHPPCQLSLFTRRVLPCLPLAEGRTQEVPCPPRPVAGPAEVLRVLAQVTVQVNACPHPPPALALLLSDPEPRLDPRAWPTYVAPAGPPGWTGSPRAATAAATLPSHTEGTGSRSLGRRTRGTREHGVGGRSEDERGCLGSRQVGSWGRVPPHRSLQLKLITQGGGAEGCFQREPRAPLASDSPRGGNQAGETGTPLRAGGREAGANPESHRQMDRSQPRPSLWPRPLSADSGALPPLTPPSALRLLCPPALKRAWPRRAHRERSHGPPPRQRALGRTRAWSRCSRWPGCGQMAGRWPCGAAGRGQTPGGRWSGCGRELTHTHRTLVRPPCPRGPAGVSLALGTWWAYARAAPEEVAGRGGNCWLRVHRGGLALACLDWSLTPSGPQGPQG